ncbi:60S ribosomal protein L36 [Citrus sinensis]|uniref:60S ribosomal protein L36 n=1 Tax=Citrus sinensis TaxID=2711 RepID=A0ACB8MHP8_CITSI|nr:60S ribosomal protein L36 [Citrus sinensis]
MVPKQSNTGLFVGLSKGHVMNKKELPKGVHFERNVIREVAGFASYKKGINELLKVGKDKRTLKVAKKKLGAHKRTKMKREEMSNVLRWTRATGGEEKTK